MERADIDHALDAYSGLMLAMTEATGADEHFVRARERALQMAAQLIREHLASTGQPRVSDALALMLMRRVSDSLVLLAASTAPRTIPISLLLAPDEALRLLEV
jgi:hypothetical protein